MSLSKPREHSFLSSQKSFFSKKPKELMAKRQGTGAKNADNDMLIDDSDSDGSDASGGGVIKKVDAFSDEMSEDDSDSDDCVVETDTKVKSTGFFQKLRLRDIMKSKGQKKVEVFREGESDEYNSEVDGEPSIDTPKVNYDILGCRRGTNLVHKPLVDLILNFEELPEDFDSMLTYENHRKELQKESDEEWRARVGESFSDEDEEEKK